MHLISQTSIPNMELYEFNAFSIRRSGMSHRTATRTYNAHASQGIAKASGIVTA
jgi:hypothetical protein